MFVFAALCLRWARGSVTVGPAMLTRTSWASGIQCRFIEEVTVFWACAYGVCGVCFKCIRRALVVNKLAWNNQVFVTYVVGFACQRWRVTWCMRCKFLGYVKDACLLDFRWKHGRNTPYFDQRNLSFGVASSLKNFQKQNQDEDRRW